MDASQTYILFSVFMFEKVVSGSVSHESMQRRQEEPFVILLLERFKTSSYLLLNASEMSQASGANQDGDIYHETS